MFWSGLIAYADLADPAEALVPVFSDGTLVGLVLVAMIQTFEFHVYASDLVFICNHS